MRLICIAAMSIGLCSCITTSEQDVREHPGGVYEFDTPRDFRSTYEVIQQMANQCWVVQLSFRVVSHVESRFDPVTRHAELVDVVPLLVSAEHIYDVQIEGTPLGSHVRVSYFNALVKGPYARGARQVENWVRGDLSCSD